MDNITVSLTPQEVTEISYWFGAAAGESKTAMDGTTGCDTESGYRLIVGILQKLQLAEVVDAVTKERESNKR